MTDRSSQQGSGWAQDGASGNAGVNTLPWNGAKINSGFSIAWWLDWFYAAAISEVESRRLFLWVPVAAGAGVVLYLTSDTEPSLWLTALVASFFTGCAILTRRQPWLFGISVAIAAIFAGMFSAGWRTARVSAPVLDRIRIVQVSGYVEQVDLRREGARLVVRLDKAEGLAPEATPYRIRVSSRKTPGVEAGNYVSFKARLLPPSHAALPGGYDFSRDAFFARIGAVGSVLGRIDPATASSSPDFWLKIYAAIDRGRNALAVRVQASIDGDAGAIAVAMVTGKRDFLTEDARELVREAGIFHIITISGVQMTLVAGILFYVARGFLSLLPGFALRYPIKKWAAGFAILGAIAYDISTGSRVGTERALFMTMIMLGAVILGRPAITMRNLALAALAVIILEPEAIMGASFQLSFAAVSALVAVYEARMAARSKSYASGASPAMWKPQKSLLSFDPVSRLHRIGHGLKEMGLATVCATGATASYMAYDFHELSPYVLIGNPLTLALIEFFAVPGALIGTILYPLGLDGPVWSYLAVGIKAVLGIAGWIASAPGSTLHLTAFASWSIVYLTLAVLCMVIWRSWAMRIMALPFAIIGIYGAFSGPRYDLFIPPSAEAIAIRGPDGKLGILGKKANSFTAEQWLRADGDGRSAAKHAQSLMVGACDAQGCVTKMQDGRMIALVYDRAAFPEDCKRAAIIITTEFAPDYCGASIVIDRRNLEATGAIAIKIDHDQFQIATARTRTENRPWSPLKPRAIRNWPQVKTPGAAVLVPEQDETDNDLSDDRN